MMPGERRCRYRHTVTRGAHTPHLCQSEFIRLRNYRDSDNRQDYHSLRNLSYIKSMMR